MKILNSLAIKNLKMNKKRTIGTVIGIILSTALICAVAGMGTSFHKTLVENAIGETGYYHYSFTVDKKTLEIVEANRLVKNVLTVYDVGTAKIELNEDGGANYIHVRSTAHFTELPYHITEGRKPLYASELVIPDFLARDKGIAIGSTVTLDVGTRMSEDGSKLHIYNPPVDETPEYIANPTTKTYKIVGTYSASGSRVIHRNGGKVSTFYVGISGEEITNDVNAFVALKNPKSDRTRFLESLYATGRFDTPQKASPETYTINTNYELLRWEVFAVSDSTISMIYSVFIVVIAIIVITSVFCIRNSFAISTMEKTKLYGMLSSVGASKKQIKKSVLFEGFIQGLIGIPLGILGGILAVFVLTKLITLILGDMLFVNIDHFYFYISYLPVAVAVILGFVTIYFSAISSARRASKVSPIDNLRNARDISIKESKLKTPKAISKLFGMGGVLAYKNLKRSKKKYRTTVISLAVSVFVFIAMSSFLNEAFGVADEYFTVTDYNIVVQNERVLNDEQIEAIRNLADVESSNVVYEANKSYLDIYDMDKVKFKKYEEPSQKCHLENGQSVCDGPKYISIDIIGLSDKDFRTYIKDLNLDYEKVKNSGILADYYIYTDEKGIDTEARRYTYKRGDTISGKIGEENFEIGVGEVAKDKPTGIDKHYYDGGFIIINKDVYTDFTYNVCSFVLDSKNPEETVKAIDKMKTGANVYNLEQDLKENRALRLIVSIFLYGFIIVITLIGVTNIFNTITANMELRSKEFAMLKSIGMTKKEFSRMVNLETIFYCCKALFFGIILGLMGSFAFFKAFRSKSNGVFQMPWLAIIISIVFVFILVYIIMRFSLAKVRRQNIIETIRNDNI